MMLGVQSYPELYTFLMGWHLYDQLWDLLAKTGIAFLPFIGIFIRNTAGPYASQETKDAASTSLRRIELSLIGTLLLIFFAVAPFVPLDPAKVSFTPLCQPNGQNNTYHPGDTQTTWDSAFVVPKQAIHVPLWWYAVLSVSEGMTSGADTYLSCKPNYRKMVTEVQTAQITSPAVRQELEQFASECYIPAKTQYLQDVKSNANTIPIIDQDRKKYGKTDTEWLGSHGFQNTYYKNLSATQPVPGFTYDPSQDINADTDKNNPPAYGTPNCYDWWNDSNGLKTKLNAALPKVFYADFHDFFQHDDTGKLKDQVLQALIDNNTPHTGYGDANNTVGDYGYSHFVNALGDWYTQFSMYPKLYAAQETVPIIQALFLLMIFTFLPFALVFSGYKPSAFVTGSIIIFSLIFWSFLWQFVSWTDSDLINALYGSNWFVHQEAGATMADIITALLIIVAPIVWFSFMGAMGIAVGSVVGAAFNDMSGVGDQAAQQGTKLTEDVAKTAVKAAVSE